MPLLPSDIERLRERGKDDLWEYLWDMRNYDRQGCAALVKELHALVDKFDAEREDIRVHGHFWLWGEIGGVRAHAPPR